MNSSIRLSLASITGAVKYQANPLVIYTSTKSEESFLSALQQSGRGHQLVEL